jgi:thymidine phosphorylase
VLAAMDTRAVGLAVIDLGGGRRSATDAIDPAVGLSHAVAVGTRVAAGDALIRVHARSREQAQAASQRLLAALTIDDTAAPPSPVLIERLARAG